MGIKKQKISEMRLLRNVNKVQRLLLTEDGFVYLDKLEKKKMKRSKKYKSNI